MRIENNRFKESAKLRGEAYRFLQVLESGGVQGEVGVGSVWLLPVESKYCLNRNF